jgi:hypothetical protein
MQYVHIIMWYVTFLTHYNSLNISLDMYDVHIIFYHITFL